MIHQEEYTEDLFCDHCHMITPQIVRTTNCACDWNRNHQKCLKCFWWKAGYIRDWQPPSET